MSKFGTKNAWFEYFGAGTWKQYCHFWNQHPRICPLQNFAEKQKWDEKWLISVILSKISRKAIVIFEIGTVKFVYLQNFTKKQKCLNLGPKMPYFDIFDPKMPFGVFLG